MGHTINVREVFVDGQHIAATASVFKALAVFMAVHFHWATGTAVFACAMTLDFVLLVAERVVTDEHERRSVELLEVAPGREPAPQGVELGSGGSG